MVSINRAIMLLKTEQIVLNQICNNMNEINDKILGLMNTMGDSEFYQAFRMGDDGYFRMQSEYNGFFIPVVKSYEDIMKLLQQQKRDKMQEINDYQLAINQSIQITETQNKDKGYTTLNMRNVAPQQGTSHFGTMVQQPESYSQPVNSTVYQGENEYSNQGLKK